MKFAAFLVLSCAYICAIHAVKLTSWGFSTPHVLGTKNITIAASLTQIKNIIFTYPPVNHWCLQTIAVV